jgi:glycosyltransferase involved in cell wall biosynthesis
VRVLHWYPNFLGGGGVANCVFNLASAQAELGAEVAVASAKTNSTPLYGPLNEIPGVTLLEWNPTWSLRAHGLQFRGPAKADVRAIRAFEPDVVHIHGEFNPDNVWARWFFGSDLILSPHGAFHPIVLQKSGRLFKAAYCRVAKSLLYARIRRFHATSPMEAAHIRQLLPSADVYCAPNGARLYPKPDTRRLTAAESLRLVSVGRLDVYTKGLDILLAALASGGRQLASECRLTLIGPDWKGGRAILEQQALELGISDRVDFAGELLHPEVMERLLAADVYVQLSRHEGFPLSVADALVTGKPLILSDRIGTVSYAEIASLKHVSVVKPAPDAAGLAIVDIASRIDDLRASAQACIGSVRNFLSWTRAARIHLEHYEGRPACARGRGEGIGDGTSFSLRRIRDSRA